MGWFLPLADGAESGDRISYVLPFFSFFSLPFPGQGIIVTEIHE